MSQRVDLYSEALTSKSTQPHNIKTQQHPTVHVRGPRTRSSAQMGDCQPLVVLQC